MNHIKNIISVTVLIFFTGLFLTVPAFSGSASELKVYNATGDITASPGELSVFIIAVEIPAGEYMYANPKGKGIGKPTEISLEKNSFIKSWEIRYPEGEKYQAKGDPDTVNRYVEIVRFPVAVTIRNDVMPGKYTVKADLDALVCTSDFCLPVQRSINLEIKVRNEKPVLSGVMLNNLYEYISLRKTTPAVSASDKTPVIGSGSENESGIPESIEFTPRYSDGEITSLLKAIVFGLLAGFILNFMPCVLPVVSLKIMSFVMNAGEKKKVLVTQGLLFSAGIVVSFLVLAGFAAYSGHKWGAFFQERFFLLVMTSFIFAMALSMFGVFTFNIPVYTGRILLKTRGVYLDAFIKGMVATLLATPCSGPFLGGTLAWTLTRPPEIIFVIFLSVGIGMALPYLVLALNPSLLRILPKPGVWMNHFETAMGFMLLFTVVYLLGILDNAGRMSLILSFLFLSIGLWQFGTFGSIDKDRMKRLISFIMLIIITVAGYGLSFRYIYAESASFHERIEFSSERLLKNRDNGIITVLEYTADWCPNCSLVEKLALEKEEVQKLFARDDIEFMVADITVKNPQAESLMVRLGSKSIPLLAVFPPGEGFTEPLCLRDIYYADDVVEAIEKAEKFLNGK